VKKQINTTTKAHLLRSAFYIILLVAVCVIPFALAQRSIGGRNTLKMAPRNHPWFGHSPLAPTSAGPAAATTACDYDFTLGTDTFVAGVTDLAPNCDDCLVPVTLPFPVTLFGTSYTTAQAGSNGSLQFGTANATFQITCSPFGVAGTTDVLAPYWVDQTVFEPNSIFTTTTGSAPNRIFYVEWRSVYFSGGALDYEIALFENGTPPFEYIYNTINSTSGNDSQLVIGSKHDDSCFTDYACDTSGGGSPPVSAGEALIATAVTGGSPTPTPSATSTVTPTPTPTGSPTCPPVITESTDQSIVSGNSVACNNGVGTTENHYFRAFNMSTFVGGVQYNVSSVDFGIESAVSGNGQGQPLTVNLYANHGSPFPGGDWQSNLIATSGQLTIPDQTLTIFNQAIAATVAAGTLELVMEVVTPDGTGDGDLFFVGSNPDGQSADSYLEASACNVNVPTPTEDLGFPGMMIVFNVNGTCGGTSPTPTPTPSATPTPTPSPTPSVTPTPSATPTVTPTPTPTPTSTPSGCAFSQGFWKNHPQAWPVTQVQLGNVTYTQDQLLSILHQPVRGNGLLILAHQEIATKLNIANGADGSCVAQTLADADALIGDLVVPPVGDGYVPPRDASPLADVLDQYNEGMLCAPSCENEGSPTPGPSPRQRPIPHPRPVRR
jgi:hypothetical protein